MTGFNISTSICDELDSEEHKIKGTPQYLAPEIYTNQAYSKASDVYSFGLVVYNIMTCNHPFDNFSIPKELKQAICDEGKRPEFVVPVAKVYRSLIERCWSQDPKSRPTFDEILEELKTNPEFITDEVDSKDYFEYIKFIDEFPITFDETKRIKDFDKSLSIDLHTFNSVETYPGLQKMSDTETNDLSLESGCKDIFHSKSRYIQIILSMIDLFHTI